jgi:hypothetical protein
MNNPATPSPLGPDILSPSWSSSAHADVKSMKSVATYSYNNEISLQPSQRQQYLPTTILQRMVVAPSSPQFMAS